MLRTLSALLLFAVPLSWAADLPVKTTPLSTHTYQAIALKGVDEYLCSDDYSTKVLNLNPNVGMELGFEKIASVEVNTRTAKESGSIEPVMLAARRAAAAVGANCLVYKSRTRFKKTKRAKNITFTAYRVTYAAKLVYPSFVSYVAQRPHKSSPERYRHTVWTMSANLYTP